MNDKENRKSMEELADEALDAVSGGAVSKETLDEEKWYCFFQGFQSLNNCCNCQSDWDFTCQLFDMDPEARYNMFGGNQFAKCPYFRSM